MRPSFFATVAGMAVIAFMLPAETSQSFAAPATGECGTALCLPQKMESIAGKPDRAPAPQRLADWNLNLSFDCPPGFRRENGECVLGGTHKRHGCPDGMHWNGDECVWDRNGKQKGGGGCVVGFRWNGHKCVPEKNKGGGGCVVGFHWNGHKCVPEESQGGGGCVVGFQWNGKKCVPKGQGNSKGCPQGTELVNGKCSKSEFPPIEGQEGDEGFSCSHNDHLENGKCVPCKAGFHVEGDECVAD